MAVSPTHNGWRWDQANSRLDFYYRGTRGGHLSASAFSIVPATTVTGLLTASAALTITTGDLTVTAGTVAVVAANIKLGAPAAFATTQPTSAVIFKQGTEFAGAIATGGGIMSSGTVLRKVIADGTVSNVG